MHKYLIESFIGEYKDILITESPYEVKDYIKRNNKSYRIFWDGIQRFFLVAPAEDYIHHDMINTAIENGYYGNMRRWEEPGYFDNIMDKGRGTVIIYSPKELADQTYGSILGEDDYDSRYVYEDGIITTRESDWWKCPLSKAMGKPESSTILNESKEDNLRFMGWIGKDKINGKTTGEIYFDKFQKLKQRIKQPYTDMYWWMKNSTPSQFKEYIDDLETEVENRNLAKQKEKEGARLVYSDSQWKVYEITSYEASAKYGKNTKWCITGSKRWNNGQDGRFHFDQYSRVNGVRFYFFIRSDGEKWALAVYPEDLAKGDSTYEIFNSEDVKVPFIPDAPKIDEIKANYTDSSDRNILVNALMNGKIQESVLLDLMEEVIYDTMAIDSIDIFDNATDFVVFLDDNIPNGYLEHTAVEDGRMSEEEYKAITGEEFSGEWDGDLPQISDSWDDSNSLSYKSKKELLRPENFKNHKYWFCIDAGAGEGIEVNGVDDFVKLYLLGNESCGFDSWDDDSIDAFYADNGVEGGNRADMFGICLANQLIYDIKAGKISPSVLDGIGLSKEFIDNLSEVNESLNESKADFERFKAWCNNDELFDRFMQMRKRLSTITFEDGSKGDDIYFWMKHNTPEDLEDTLNDIEATPTKKERERRAKEGAKLLLDDGTWKVYEISSVEASQKYGKNTTWCISGYDAGDYYIPEDDGVYYFIIGKGTKYALRVYKSGFRIWNEEDDNEAYIKDGPDLTKLGLPDIRTFKGGSIEKDLKELYDGAEIKDIETLDYASGEADFYIDLDTHEFYKVTLGNGDVRYCYNSLHYDNPFVDVTDEFIEWKKDGLGEERVNEDMEKRLTSDRIDDFIEDLYDLRKDSIAKDGEYGIGNLVFKEFRNLGYLDNLKEIKNKLKSKELSLEELEEAKKSKKRKYHIDTDAGDVEKNIEMFNMMNGSSATCEELED